MATKRRSFRLNNLQADSDRRGLGIGDARVAICIVRKRIRSFPIFDSRVFPMIIHHLHVAHGPQPGLWLFPHWPITLRARWAEDLDHRERATYIPCGSRRETCGAPHCRAGWAQTCFVLSPTLATVFRNSLHMTTDEADRSQSTWPSISVANFRSGTTTCHASPVISIPCRTITSGRYL